MKLFFEVNLASIVVLLLSTASLPEKSFQLDKGGRVELITANITKKELETYYMKVFKGVSVEALRLSGVEFCLVSAINSPGVTITDVLLYVRQGGRFRLIASFWNRYGVVHWKVDEKASTITFTYTETNALDVVRIDVKRLQNRASLPLDGSDYLGEVNS